MVNTLQPQISKHVNDIIQKYASSLFRNVTLDFYGIKSAPIKELINPEIPIVELSGGAADMVFLLEDDSYLHFAFETGHNSNGAMLKCIGYDTRLYERDGRFIHTVIIYTAEVMKKPEGLVIGSLAYNPDVILMCNYDGNAIFNSLEAKINAGHELTDVDIMNLVLLPLMRHTIPKGELALKTIGLAGKIPDLPKRDASIVAAFAFASKYLEKADLEKLKGVIKMTDLAAWLTEEDVMDEKMKIAKSMLKDKVTIEFVSRHTGLDEDTVQKLKDEVDAVESV